MINTQVSRVQNYNFGFSRMFSGSAQNIGTQGQGGIAGADTSNLSSRAQSLLNSQANGIDNTETIGGTWIPSKSVIYRVDRAIGNSAGKYGIPVDMLRAVAWQESKWNPYATSYDGGHGKGVMQIDDRWHSIANTWKVWNPEQNIDYGAKLLKQFQKESYGSWWSALRKYNGGWSYPQKIYNLMYQKPWLKEF